MRKRSGSLVVPPFGAAERLTVPDPLRPVDLLQSSRCPSQFSVDRRKQDVAPNNPNQRLLNHLIRAYQQRLRDRDAECLGRLEIDHQLELGRLLDGEASRLRAS